LFPLGNVYLTVGAREALEESNQLPKEFLLKHQKGEWGIICEDDKKENELSVKEGFRILSAYKTNRDVKIWVITEADRNSTTILLPSEY
jgi:ribosomal protein L39E